MPYNFRLLGIFKDFFKVLYSVEISCLTEDVCQLVFQQLTLVLEACLSAVIRGRTRHLQR